MYQTQEVRRKVREREKIERALYFGVGVPELPLMNDVNNRKQCILERYREIQMSLITL
jgi:hypothetical protein